MARSGTNPVLARTAHAPKQLTFADTHLDPREKPRLSKQCIAILKRLLEGEASNRELSELALKYTSRISDCRHNGIGISVTHRDHETGLVMYKLDDRDAARDALGGAACES